MFTYQFGYHQSYTPPLFPPPCFDNRFVRCAFRWGEVLLEGVVRLEGVESEIRLKPSKKKLRNGIYFTNAANWVLATGVDKAEEKNPQAVGSLMNVLNNSVLI